MDLTKDHYHAWVGKSEIRHDLITNYPMEALAATLDKSAIQVKPGAALPPLWHWLYFLDISQQSDLAKDGHARKGDFLPPIELPRRMWAGSRIEFFRHLHVGEQVQRESSIKSIQLKTGRSGQLAFICVKHVLSNHAGMALVEEHDIVYRENSSAASSAAESVLAPKMADYKKIIEPDPVLLFRYSALTFNGHRIHYDRDYVTRMEGYPGLVVHGPLLATLLADLLLTNLPDMQLDAFEFRAIRPVFDLAQFHVCGLLPDQNQICQLWVKDSSGFLCMQASARVSNKKPSE